MDGWVRMAWPMANLADPGSPRLLITSDIWFHNDTPCMLIKIQTILFRQKALRIWCCGPAATNTPLGRTEGFICCLRAGMPFITDHKAADRLVFRKASSNIDMKVGSGGRTAKDRAQRPAGTHSASSLCATLLSSRYYQALMPLTQPDWYIGCELLLCYV